MKSTSKQSQKIGGLVTREVALGVDGPLTVSLADNITLIGDNGVRVTIPASNVITALTFDSGLLAKLQDQTNQLSADLERLNNLQLQLDQLKIDLEQLRSATHYECLCAKQPNTETPLAPANKLQSPIITLIENPDQEPFACGDCKCDDVIQRPNTPEPTPEPAQIADVVSDAPPTQDVTRLPEAVAQIAEQITLTPDHKPSIPIAAEKAPERPKQRGRTRKQ